MSCVSASSDWESTLPCSHIPQGANRTTSVTYLNSTNGLPFMIEPWTALWYYGLGIQIRLQATDAQPAAPTGTGSGPSNSSGGGNQGLSAATAAGIGIG